MVHSITIEVSTQGFCDVIDVTPQVIAVVEKSGIKSGIVCIANPGSTAGITTIEFEPGAVGDLKAALEKLAPEDGHYRHNDTWDDGNGFAHLRSALIGASQSFPVREGKVALGTWQQIVLLDFDNRPRSRKLVVSVVGE
ncbi:YjbQ family protein [candidate division WOR-3 bacterium]|uniref:YjbQ family protein n=1 Tax=candidate division WOR-3 bacterium TaxID=2052148 RepID=A0A937XF62_UNCW3|nr:YjbQ family protein [candidate division WOR-3 bacterium]